MTKVHWIRMKNEKVFLMTHLTEVSPLRVLRWIWPMNKRGSKCVDIKRTSFIVNCNWSWKIRDQEPEGLEQKDQIRIFSLNTLSTILHSIKFRFPWCLRSQHKNAFCKYLCNTPHLLKLVLLLPTRGVFSYLMPGPLLPWPPPFHSDLHTRMKI